MTGSGLRLRRRTQREGSTLSYWDGEYLHIRWQSGNSEADVNLGKRRGDTRRPQKPWERASRSLPHTTTPLWPLPFARVPLCRGCQPLSQHRNVPAGPTSSRGWAGFRWRTPDLDCGPALAVTFQRPLAGLGLIWPGPGICMVCF